LHELGLRRPRSIVDFYLEFLGQPVLYPVQCLLLKVMFLEADHLTDYDRRRLAQLGGGFAPGVGDDGSPSFVGSQGVPPDVIKRMRHCREAGYRWFPEVLMVVGRRGSKGHLGAVCAARVIWELMLMVDPHAELKIMAGKRLTIPVFAGQADQARANQFRDIAEMITRAPCFEPFVARQTASRLLLRTPQQILNREHTNPDAALIEVVAREATPLSARGPATPMVLFDEMAHMNSSGANRSAEEVFTAALPALAQFDFAMLYEASSPWDKTGQFYANCREALVLDPAGESLHPDSLLVQVPSWAMYEDWELTRDANFVTYPDGPAFPTIERPYLTRTSRLLRRAEARDPVSFAVEFGAQWASVQNPFLDERHVKRIFAYADRQLSMRERGSLDHDYYAHIDLARRRANTAFVVGHTEDLDGHRHFIVDLIKVWRPDDYDDGEIDQYGVAHEALEYIRDFRIAELTVDSYDAPLITQYLARLVSQHNMSWCPRFFEVPASAKRNRLEAKIFRDAIGLDRVHSPEHDDARRELLFLQQGADGKVGPPTTGLVTTSDIADCFFALTAKLLQGHLDIIDALANLQPHFGRPEGLTSPRDEAIFNALGAGFDPNRRALVRRNRYANPARGRPDRWRHGY
jgi:hypothetical protein